MRQYNKFESSICLRVKFGLLIHMKHIMPMSFREQSLKEGITFNYFSIGSKHVMEEDTSIERNPHFFCKTNHLSKKTRLQPITDRVLSRVWF